MEGMARQVHEALAGLVTRTTADAAAITAAIEDLGHRYQSYRPALQLARMLLLGGGPIAVVGEGGISGWWIDMPSLFERAVTQGVARWADRMGYRAVAQPRHRGAILDADRALYQETRPDVEILDGDGRVLAIVDAKYKEYLRSDSARGAPARSIDPQDLYQLSFYGRSAPEARLFLVAPLEDAPQIAPRYRTLHIHDATLEVVGLDLARLPEAGALPLWARP